MKFHKQNIMHNPDAGQYGNCHQTAIACMLDKALDEVPHFGRHFNDSVLFYEEVDSYLASQGMASFTMAFNGTDGLALVLDSIGAMNKGEQYLLGGRSSRGINHTVIGKGDKSIHDPHPSGEGICAPCDDGYFWVTVLIPLSQCNRN